MYIMIKNNGTLLRSILHESQTQNSATIRRTEETSVSRHHRGAIDGRLKLFARHHGIEGFKGGPIMPRDGIINIHTNMDISERGEVCLSLSRNNPKMSFRRFVN